MLAAFLTYLFAYVFGWITSAPVTWVLWIFAGLHCVFAGWAIRAIVRRVLAVGIKPLLPWVGLFFVLWLPGAYLEFPSDPWEHARRLMMWEGTDRFGEQQFFLFSKFSYFWGWSFLHWIPIEFKQAFLDLYSAFWQWVVAVSFYRMSRRLGADEKEAALQLLALFLFFGTNVFNLRYYALSSTIVAFAAYFEAVGLLVGPLTRSQLLRIAGLLIVMAFNHVQEPLLFCISAAAVGVVRWIPNRRRLLWLAIAGAFLTLPLWRETLRPYRLGLYLETWSAVGVAGLLAAAVFFQRRPLTSALVLAPTLFLFWPPSAWVLRQLIGSDYTMFRALLAFPPTYVLISLLVERFGKSKSGWVAITVGMLALGSIPFFPVRGKLFFQCYPGDPVLRLLPQQATARWLLENRGTREPVGFLTDTMTRYALKLYLGKYRGGPGWEEIHRLTPQPYRDWQLSFSDPDHLAGDIRNLRIRSILVPDLSKLPYEPASPIGRLSQHWIDDASKLRQWNTPQLESAGRLLVEKVGWTVTALPPYYWLFEAPSE